MKIGIIGSGYMGRLHAKTLSRIPAVKVVAVCSLKSKINVLSEDFKAPQAKIYYNVDEMFEKEILDAVYICLPPFAHNGELEKPAERRINIFIEKPIALNSVKAEKMVEAVNKNNVKSQVGFHNRFRYSVRKVKNLISNGKAGKPVLFTGRFWTQMSGPDWWTCKSKSGGQLFEQGIHIYDIARFLFGDVKSANGMLANLCHKNQKDYDIDDVSVSILNFKNGGVASISTCNTAVPMHYFADFRAVFSNLTLDYASTGQNWKNPDTATIYYTNSTSFTTETYVENSDPYFEESVDFINSIREDRKTICPIEEGFESIKLIEKIIGGVEK
ncbi:MAG TPA: Gfo/Idh/MocA family oxidoreductase [Victivallales bacterium]|nr:Gfo/Idh/MocA family oxidoreductase [Victivallales bacterium]HPO90458.1 Gfo/Idh/MocA family oxidoreductase [Victivallales bacterium]HRR28309.1 Gfo/Idh/MocA family oxidoreductase [Victivallales bacterium]HRU00490.1 Gfo/Idh/MocA family oxidoreductase [Victivallales bacterium]